MAPRTRGRRVGDKRALTAEQETHIRQTICDKRPELLKMEFALWSRAAVKALIERDCQVTLHLRSVGKYLARWGFTPQKLAMLASVTHQGKARWMIIDGAFNHEKLIEFFEALVVAAGRKVFLILDNLGVHPCKPVKVWLAEHRDPMEVFYLPSYNLEERLNADLKRVIRRKVAARTKAKLRAATEEHMIAISHESVRVKAYFRNPHVKYAA